MEAVKAVPVESPPAQSRAWLSFALVTTVTWGIWGALIEIPEQAGFPPTLGYCVWALTMIPCALVVLGRSGWGIERALRPMLLGLWAGLTGAGGQIVLFEALRRGPAYVVFPVVSLYPVVTVALSLTFLKERPSRRAWLGIACALPAIGLLSYVPPDDTVIRGYLWLGLAIGVFLAWGIQAYLLKLVNQRMSAESLFFYMTATAVGLIPVAIAMTDFRRSIEWGFRGPYLAGMVHLLNSIGALTLVYALKWGKAVVVVPMTALAPVITIVLSLILYHRAPLPIQGVGMALAVVSMALMAE